MSPLPDIKLRVVSNLPASIQSGIGVTVDKASGHWSFKLDYSNIQQKDSVPPSEYAQTFQLYWNGSENSFTLVPYSVPSARVTGTSQTSVEIGTGPLSFTVETGISWIVGNRLRGSDQGNTGNFVEGVVTSYDPATGALNLDADLTGGSGTVSSWLFGITGERGSAGADGTGDMNKADNLAGLDDIADARENIGLGSTGGLLQLDANADSTAISNAISTLNAAGGGVLKLLKGTYDLTDVALQSNVTVQLEPGVVINQTGGTSSSNIMAGSGATSGSAISLSANASENAKTATVASTTGIAAGDYCIIRDSQYLSSPSGRNQEIVKVQSLTSTVFTFERALTSTYLTSSSAEIIKLIPIVNAHVKGDGTINIGTNKGGGLAFIMGVGCSLGYNVKVNRPGNNPAFRLELCTNSKITGGVAANGQNLASSGQGYGFELNESCTFCEVYGFESDNVRENTVTNRSRHNKIHDSFALNNYDSGFNTHGAACHYNEFYNLKTVGGGAGITIGWSSSLAADNNNTVRNCNIRFPAGSGVSVKGTSGHPQSGNLTQDNLVVGATGIAISIGLSDKSPVLGNRVIMTSVTTTGIDNDTCTDAICCNNVVSGDGATTNVVGIRGGTCAGGTISHNVVRNINSGGGSVNYYAPSGSTNLVVVLNADDNSNVSLTGAATNKLNTWN
jgi:hypothetical protein